MYCGVCGEGCFLVMGAAALAGVAAEDTSVEGFLAGGVALYGEGGDAEAGVDHLIAADGAIGTVVHAAVAVTAAICAVRGVVMVDSVVEQENTEEHEGAKLRGYKQCLAPYPSESRLDGELLFEQGCAIDAAAPIELRVAEL